MNEKEMKLYVSGTTSKRQDDDVNVKSVNRDERSDLDHAERGHFIPFADVLKKLG